MALHGNMMLAPAGGYSGYSITNSAITDGSGDYWSRPYSSGDRRTNTFHIGFRVLDPDYRSTLLSAGSVGNGHVLELENSGLGTAKTNSGSSLNLNTSSGKLFRDVGSFYALTIRYDTTQATDSDRVKFWVNGVEGTWTSTFAWPGLNDDMNWSNNVTHCLGSRYSGTNDAKLQFAYFIHQEGIAGDHLTVGEFYNGGTQYRLIDFSGISVGTEGCILDFTNGADLGEDQAGSNDWTTNGSPVQSSDSPTKNYATLNPLQYRTTATLSLGNTKKDNNGSSSNQNAGSTIAVSSGKWYVEAQATGGAGSNFCFVDINEVHTLFTTNVNLINTPNNSILWADNIDDLRITDNGSLTTHAAELTAGNPGLNTPIGIVLNLDDDEVRLIDANGITSTARSIPSGITWQFAVGGSNSDDQQVFFREEDWTHTPPDGYKAIAAVNLPEVTITDPGEYFNAVAYSGTGTAPLSVSGVGFPPDLVVTKRRDSAGSHAWYDVVRGTQKVLQSNSTAAEVSQTYGLSSFDSDGFTYAADNANNPAQNATGGSHISWNWKAGGSGVANTDGTISSTVSVNDDAGFSIVSYTGTGSAATVGHGLSDAPEMIICKNLTDAVAWCAYHSGVAADPETDYLVLNGTGAAADDSTLWNDIAPTSSVFSVGSSNNVNGSTDDIIAYCFRSIPGYSKVFSYTGNGSTDGTFVWLGFRPAFVMIKNSSSATNWKIFDSAREPDNLVGAYLEPNTAAAEANLGGGNTTDLDFLSNGFKLRGNASTINNTGSNHIGIAFAENPFGASNLPLGLAR
jgi:hypothetical protein